MKRSVFGKVACGIGACVFFAFAHMASEAKADETIINPDWDMTIDDYGYADLAFDRRPDYMGREYLSGEWAAAVAYTRDMVPFGPTWLNPEFIFPDWISNSDFLIESTEGLSKNAYGLDVFRTTIVNADLRIEITSEMIDSTNGIPQGVAPRSSPRGSFTLSDRYLMRQTFTVSNISGQTLEAVQFFKFLHALQATRAVYDDRNYGPALNGFHHTISQQGYDFGRAGRTYLTAMHFDTVALHANVAPSAWEVGRYGDENVDDHVFGKPSVGVHWSVESGALSGVDYFEPGNRWVSGAMRFDLGSLESFASTTVQFIMSLRTLTAAQEGKWIAWGNDASGQCNVPSGTIYRVSAGGSHNLNLNSNGQVVAWGDNALGQASVPPGLSNVVDIAAGGNHSLALLSDGTVTGWGDNAYGQAEVPFGVADVVAIAAGGNHSLALFYDGTVFGWGDFLYGQIYAPYFPDYVETIAAGGNHSLALLYDGTVTGWGDDTYGQIDIPYMPDYVAAIAAGSNHSLALLHDGTVIGWGDNIQGQVDVPYGLAGVAAIAAGGNHSMALLEDGNVVCWGDNSSGQTNAPAWLRRVKGIAAGGAHSLAIVTVPPALDISRSAPNAVLSWSAVWSPEIADAVLEQRSDMRTGAWTPVPYSGTFDGVLFKIEVPIEATCRFFRLRIP